MHWLENLIYSPEVDLRTLSLPLSSAQKAAFAALPIGVCIANLRSELVYLNPRAHEWLGGPLEKLPEGETRYKAWAEARGFFETNRVRPLSREHSPWAAAREGKCLGATDIFVRQNPAPCERYLRLTSAPIVDGEGKLAANLISISDVSSLYQSQAELSAAGDFFRTVFYTVHEALAVSSPESGAFLFANQAFVDLLQTQRHKIVGAANFERHIWREPEQREKIARELTRTGRMEAQKIDLALPADPTHHFAFDLIHWGTRPLWLWKYFHQDLKQTHPRAIPRLSHSQPTDAAQEAI